MIRLKFDVMAALKDAGFNSSRIRKEKILSESTMTDLRHGIIKTMDTLYKLCTILKCQPNDIIEIIPDDEDKIRFF